jgi:hypothetical protein
LTVKSARDITRLEIEPTEAYAPRIGFLGRNEEGMLVAWGSGLTTQEALSSLVLMNYERVKCLVMQRDNYKCVVCGSYCVQCHHKKFRSHGRLDTTENLVCLCPACHGVSHGTQ